LTLEPFFIFVLGKRSLTLEVVVARTSSAIFFSFLFFLVIGVTVL
jgi:hypothetical protein